MKLTNLIVLTCVYDDVTISFYMSEFATLFTYPLACMIVSKIILGFIELVHMNERLIEMIRHILKVLPESVLIQSFDADAQDFIVSFLNNSASTVLVKYEQPIGKPLFDEKLDFIVQDVKLDKQIEHFQSQGNELRQMMLSSLLDKHQQALSDHCDQVMSIVETRTLDPSTDSNTDGENKDTRFYELKSQHINYYPFERSFMHVFVDVTDTKKYEQQRTVNELLHLMFSSVSHEFRTPLNAFTNSLFMLEANYKQVIEAFINAHADEARK